VPLAERDFFAQPLSEAEVADLARRAGGIRPIFAFNSPSFKKLQRAPGAFSDGELVALILEEPRLLRRPLAVTTDGRVLVGGKAVSEVSPAP
jgi:arsenate reductase-like glutaredoxin family protein